MPIPFTGGCACSAIRYTGSAEPLASLNCHCRDCQQASGSAFAAVLVMPVAAFSLTKGKPTYYDVKADNGNNMSRGFCGTCGSPILIRHLRITPGPEVVVIQAASLDDPSWFQPAMDIYTSRAQPWDFMDSALPKFEKGSDHVLAVLQRGGTD